MSGDYSRIAFDPWLDDLGVLWQQGRPVTDRDCNDFVLQSTRRTQAGTLDTIGPEAVPDETKDGFKVAASGGKLTIARGRMYVDGLLAENHGAPPANGPLSWDPHLAEQFGSEPLDYAAQPYDPNPPALPTGNGPHLVYLDVWQREVTQYMRDGLVDSALGVDTSARLQTVWQVKVLADVGDDPDCSTPLDQVKGWLPQNAHSAGRLTSDTATVPGQPDPCQVPPKSGYKGQENQLYRVEIHKGGAPGTATFKWSRDDASIETRVTGIPTLTQLVVESVGRDDVLRFSDGDWIEITDDWLELHNQPGLLRHIKAGGGVDDVSRTITLDMALPAGQFPVDAQDLTIPERHTRIRRWDQKSKVLDASGTVIQDLDTASPPPDQGIVVPAGATQVLLEQGIVVSFGVEPSTGEFRSGDWWVFAARAGEGTIEKLKDAPPRGIHHHYAHLGLWDPSTGDVDDCRVHWPPDCGGCCTVNVAPGESIQGAIDSLPDEGGCVCLKTGVHEIEAPIKILRSSIILHGESPGAVVHSPEPTVLIVGDPKLPVSDVVVEDIAFEAGEASGASLVAIVQASTCSGLRIAKCRLAGSVSKSPVQVALLLTDVRSVELCGNRAQGVAYGVVIDGYGGRVEVSGNEFEGTVSEAVGVGMFGFVGVMLSHAQGGSCRVEDNTLVNFMMGVQVGEDAEDCVVADNTILRKPLVLQDKVPFGIAAFRSYLEKRTYAIEVQSARCEVRGNRIDLRSASWGGVRASAAQVKIFDNLLEAAPLESPDLVPLPASIYCFADAAGASAAHDADIAGNRLLGPQVGIVISRIDDASVAGNRRQGGWYGVFVDDCRAACVCDNEISEVLFGVYLTHGERNRVRGNDVHDVFFGMLANAETDLEIDGNRLYNCGVTGAWLLVRGATAFRGNRVARCAYGDGLMFGVLVLDAQVALASSGSMLRVEGCELLDTGISPDGKPGAGTVWGICAWVHSCQVNDNHVGYSDLEPALPAIEHRALVLAGPIAYTTGAAVIGVLSCALIESNQFRGPGLSSLVELLSIPIVAAMSFSFQSVTFSGNACEHWNAKPNDKAATVHLRGAHPIAMGNHVKAADKGINSISLGGPAKGTIMGNVATGAYIQLGAAIPAPVTNFNVIL